MKAQCLEERLGEGADGGEGREAAPALALDRCQPSRAMASASGSWQVVNCLGGAESLSKAAR